jgi:RHS repeat-associated protein
MNNSYSYDKEINILNIVNNAPIPTNNLMGGSSNYQYSYDDLYRVTNAIGNFNGSSHSDSFNLAMNYNTVSSILKKNQVNQRRASNNQNWTIQNQTTYNYNYNYNAGSQPHAPIHIGTEGFTYDANGNQLGWQDDVSAQNRQLVWDEENRVQTLSDNGDQFNYTYDASGTRVLKSNGNGQTVAVNGKQVAQSSGIGNYTVYVNPYEVVQSGGYTKHFYIEGQRIVSKIGASGSSGVNKPETIQFYYHPDHLGNSAFITDGNGEVYQHLEYFPFGETFIDEHSNQQLTPYLYNGKELDDETGLYYYGARYYDPVTSIWENVDPSWETPQQIDKSPYAYVQNNPVILVDPDGNQGEPPEQGGPINIRKGSIQGHVIKRHTVGGPAEFIGKSKFNVSSVVDLTALIKSGDAVKGKRQPERDGKVNYKRKVDAGAPIGQFKTEDTGAGPGVSTTMITIITDVDGNFITAYPDRPKPVRNNNNRPRNNNNRPRNNNNRGK